MTNDYQSIVAVFVNNPVAEAARSDLIAAGVPERDITVRDQSTATQSATERREPSFWEWLFGSDYEGIPESDRETYAQRVESGETVVIVRAVDTPEEYERVCDILDAHRPVSLDDSHVAADVRQGVGATQTMGTMSQTMYQDPGVGGPIPAGTGGPVNSTAEPMSQTTVEEEVIPVVKEHVEIGKRQVRSARAYRVRTSVEEVPVEKDVKLHDETVTIERRVPRSDQGATSPVGYTGTGDPFTDKVVEVHEMHEEPVVTKTAEEVEEVVVRKEGHDRTETVRDTVRETKVDIDKPTDRDSI